MSVEETGSLRTISLAPAAGDLEVTFHDAVPVALAVQVGTGRTLVVTLSPLSSAQAPPSFGALPVAASPGIAASNGGEIEVVPLKYADVSEIVGLLVAGQQIPASDTFVPQQQSFGSSGLSGSFGGLGSIAGQAISSSPIVQSAGAIATPQGQQINENIGVDRRLNAIVLSGAPDVVERLKAKIAKLDVPLANVALETQIVELTDSAARDVGIDYTNAGGPAASATYQSKSLSSGTLTVNLQAAVFAQIAKGQGRLIARPSVVAQNGSSAQIITGDALPIVTAIAVSGVNAISQQVQYVNVGVSLQIQPRISSDGFVTSHIFSQVSSVTGYQQGYPTLSQRQASTAATVRDGDAFVIGGLLQQNEISNLAKVPGIGDLPIIGGLFRVRHDTRQATNLYIIVVPHIIAAGNPPPPGFSAPRR